MAVLCAEPRAYVCVSGTFYSDCVWSLWGQQDRSAMLDMRAKGWNALAAITPGSIKMPDFGEVHFHSALHLHALG